MHFLIDIRHHERLVLRESIIFDGVLFMRKIKKRVAGRKAAPKRTGKTTTKAKKTTRKRRIRLWTAKEISVLRKAYKTTPTKEIAKELKRTVIAVRGKAVTLGLKKRAIKKAAPKRKKAAKKKIRRR